MRESGRMIKHMDMGGTCMWMVLVMKGTGKMISSTGLERKSGQMELNMRVST